MPARSARRRQHKRLGHLPSLTDGQRRVVASWHLRRWRKEVLRRAQNLGAPAVWALAAEVQAKAAALDPSGELAADLQRVCAEAIASVAGRHLVSGSRPVAERARMEERATPSAMPRSLRAGMRREESSPPSTQSSANTNAVYP